MRSLLLATVFVSSVGFGQEFKMAAFGDSISQGTNSSGFGTKRANSWSTGTAVKSHLAFLKEQHPEGVEAVNASVNGARADDLESQLESLGDFVPDYLTIEIGGNDACHGKFDVSSKVDLILDKVTILNPEIQIVLVPIPNLLSVRKLGEVRSHCRSVWKAFNACPEILGKNANPEAIQNKIDVINDELTEVAGKYSQVSYKRELGDFEFAVEDISKTDCFHPSVSGQEKLSEMTQP